MRRALREFFPQCEEEMENEPIKQEFKPIQNFIKKEDKNETIEMKENEIDFKLNDIQYQSIEEFRKNNPHDCFEEERMTIGQSELQNIHKDDSSNIVDDFNKAKATNEIYDLMAVKGKLI